MAKEGTAIFIVKGIKEENFTKDALSKKRATHDMVFPRDLLVIDPFALKNGAINKVTTNSGNINEVLSKGFYGFKNNKTDHIFLINCKDIKII
mgnify:FL=1